MKRIILPTPEGTGREEQTQKGLWVRRREFIACCGAGIAATALTSASQAMASDSSLSFDDFITAANEAARAMSGDRSVAGQDRYLRTLSAHAAGLRAVPAPAEWRDSGQSDESGTYIGFNPGGVGFVVLHWRMEPGTRILPHAHTYGNVVTVGLEGSVRVRNYEVVGERDYTTDADFKARCTLDQQLSAGDTNLVSLERNYIHGFDAGADGARGLDITTRLNAKPDYTVPYLELGAQRDIGPADGDFSARWYRR